MAIPTTAKEFNRFIDDNRARTLAYLGKRYTALGHEDLEDVFQESSVALFLNLQEGRYQEQSNTLYAYFLRICINQALKAISKGGPAISLDENWKVGDEDEYKDDKIDELLNFVYDVDDYDERQQSNANNIVGGIMNELSQKCQDLLWGHYGDNLSWEILADMYQLSNANSARTTANRCRNGFKDLFNKKNASINGK